MHLHLLSYYVAARDTAMTSTLFRSLLLFALDN
jgi:hypothetical protein